MCKQVGRQHKALQANLPTALHARRHQSPASPPLPAQLRVLLTVHKPATVGRNACAGDPQVQLREVLHNLRPGKHKGRPVNKARPATRGVASGARAASRCTAAACCWGSPRPGRCQALVPSCRARLAAGPPLRPAGARRHCQGAHK